MRQLSYYCDELSHDILGISFSYRFVIKISHTDIRMQGMITEEEVTTRPKSLKRSKPPPYDPSAIIDDSIGNEKSIDGGIVGNIAHTAVAGSGVSAVTEKQNTAVLVDKKESKVDGIAFHMSRDRDTKRDVKVETCFGLDESHNIKTKTTEKEQIQNSTNSDAYVEGDAEKSKKKGNNEGLF